MGKSDKIQMAMLKILIYLKGFYKKTRRSYKKLSQIIQLQILYKVPVWAMVFVSKLQRKL